MSEAKLDILIQVKDLATKVLLGFKAKVKGLEKDLSKVSVSANVAKPFKDASTAATKLGTGVKKIPPQIDLLRSKTEQLRRAFKTTAAATKNISAGVKRVPDALRKSRVETKRLAGNLNKSFAATVQISTKARTLSTSLARANRQARKLKDNLRGARTTAARLKTGLSGASTASVGLFASLQKNETQLRQFGIQLALIGALFVAAFSLAIVSSITLEQRMVEVQKTTGLLDREIALLKKDFVALARTIPVSANELGQIGTVAGQLGISGRKNILAFTETIAKIATVTEFTVEGAAEDLARLANIFRIPIAEVSGLASVINELENTTTATAPVLANFMRRTATASKQLGISADEVAALSATLIDLGFRAELAGTAVSKVFIEMAKDGQAFADSMQITLAEFKVRMTRDAIGTVLAWAEAVGNLKGAEVLVALDQAGISATRVVSVFGALASRTDLFARNLTIARREMRQQISLQREFDTFLKSTQNQLKILRNNFTAVSLVLGDTLLPAFRFLIAGVKDFVNQFLLLPVIFQQIILVGATLSASMVALSGALLLMLAFVGPIRTGLEALGVTFASTALKGNIFSRVMRLLTLDLTTMGTALKATTLATLGTATGFTFLRTTLLSLFPTFLSFAGIIAGLLSIFALEVKTDFLDFFTFRLEQLEISANRTRFALNKLVNENKVRSASALIDSLKDIDKLNKTQLERINEEFRIRGQILKLQIGQQEKALELRKTFLGTITAFFSNSKDTSQLVEELAKAKDQLELINKAREPLSQKGLVNVAEIKDLSSAVEQASAFTKDSVAGIISSLNSLNNIRFDSFVKELKRTKDAQISALKDTNDLNAVAKVEAAFSKDLLALQEARTANAIRNKRAEIRRLAELTISAARQDKDAQKTLLNDLRALTTNRTRFEIEQAKERSASIESELDRTSRFIARFDSIIEESQRNRDRLALSIEERITKIREQGLTANEVIQARFKRRSEISTKLEAENNIETLLRFKDQLIKIADDIGGAKQARIGGRILNAGQLREQAVETINILKDVETKIINIREAGAIAAKATAEASNDFLISEGIRVKEALVKLGSDNIDLNMTVNVKSLGTQLTDFFTNFKDARIEVLASFNKDDLSKQIEAVFTRVFASNKPLSGFASGGVVSGAGTSTSDSILARLSKGEFVVRASAVRNLGVGFLEMLNGMGQSAFNLPFDALKLPQFAVGGLVGPNVANLNKQAERDVVELNFNIGERQFPVQGDRDVVQELSSALRDIQNQIIGG